jgi:hypothetical protein
MDLMALGAFIQIAGFDFATVQLRTFYDEGMFVS